MNTKTLYVVLLALLLAGSVIYTPAYAQDPYADEVTTVTFGEGAGFGQAYFPGNVVGPPHGNENANQPQDSEEHLVSLGNGGRIVLSFVDNILGSVVQSDVK